MKNKYTKPTITTKTQQGLPLAFKAIQDSCEVFAGERRLLSGVLAKYNDALAQLRAAHLPTINTRAMHTGSARLALLTLIDNSRALFEKPKTQIFSDIKVGLHKQKGATEIANEDQTIALIAKHFPERLDDLAPATRRVSKSALANLTAAELKKIGVEITGDTDVPLIKPQDSDLEKAVLALLNDAAQIQQLPKAA